MMRRAFASKRKPQVDIPVYPVVDVVAACMQAFVDLGRVNKNDTRIDEHGVPVKVNTNRSLAENYLADSAVLNANRDLAQAAISGLRDHMVMTLLKGSKINDFYASIHAKIEQETATVRDLPTLVWLPKIYQDIQRREEMLNKLTSATSQHQGTVGSKIMVDLTVLRKYYFEQYNCWSVLATDPHGNLYRLFTSHESRAVSGRYQAKVRAHVVERESQQPCTQLNYVKPA